ncbi:family 52 olfactory receptor [Candidatus Parcubacteria bacterium]|nr:family 52 olfactory receptor [Candidatus Parcubacteria bacterium]
MRTFQIVVVALVLLVVAAPAKAQNFVGTETEVKSGDVVSLIDSLYGRTFNKSVGLFAWGQAQTDGWGQVYGGVVYTPKPWIALSLGTGVEKDAHPGRIGTSAWMSGHGYTLLAVYENGGSGAWYKTILTKAVTSKIAVGVFSRRFAGTGPLVEYSANKVVKIWVTAGPDLEDHHKKLVAGLNIGLP